VWSGDAGGVEKKQQAAARARSSGTTLLRLFLVVTIYLGLDFVVSVWGSSFLVPLFSALLPAKRSSASFFYWTDRFR
jgi:hypothetical protein